MSVVENATVTHPHQSTKVSLFTTSFILKSRFSINENFHWCIFFTLSSPVMKLLKWEKQTKIWVAKDYGHLP